jgi:hypothetical protein
VLCAIGVATALVVILTLGGQPSEGPEISGDGGTLGSALRSRGPVTLNEPYGGVLVNLVVPPERKLAVRSNPTRLLRRCGVFVWRYSDFCVSGVCWSVLG